jgi:GNAT superfamily N-acetyltransferase
MDSKLRIEHLADYPEAIPILKEWFESEWGSYYGPTGPGDAQRDLLADAHRGALPLGIVALDEHELCGVAALRAESIVTHAHLRPWAAAGLVKPCLRRRGIGTALIRALEETARSLGIPTSTVPRAPRTISSSVEGGSAGGRSHITVKRCASIKRCSNHTLQRTGGLRWFTAHDPCASRGWCGPRR